MSSFRTAIAEEGAILKLGMTPASLLPFTLLCFEKLNLTHIKQKYKLITYSIYVDITLSKFRHIHN
jgi:hypothetical protein